MSLLRAVRRFGMALLLLLAGLSAEGMAGGLLTKRAASLGLKAEEG
ncbi:hypothetical protein [Halomonas sp. BM-2019]|nr:MAG: hypothetical protein J5F18_09705 [Halomonas sp. BM-2019]